jgi:hypothetical protein
VCECGSERPSQPQPPSREPFLLPEEPTMTSAKRACTEVDDNNDHRRIVNQGYNRGATRSTTDFFENLLRATKEIICAPNKEIAPSTSVLPRLFSTSSSKIDHHPTTRTIEPSGTKVRRYCTSIHHQPKRALCDHYPQGPLEAQANKASVTPKLTTKRRRDSSPSDDSLIVRIQASIKFESL